MKRLGLADVLRSADPLPPRAVEFECRHQRLPGDGTPPCGCWSVEEERDAALLPG